MEGGTPRTVEVAALRLAGGDELLGTLEARAGDTFDDARREALGHGRAERVQAVDLQLPHGPLLADEDAAVGDLAVPAPEAPAILRERTRAVEDDALGEGLVMLQQQQHALMKELLAEREAKFHLGAAEQHRALLDEWRLVDEAALVAARGRLEPL